MGVEKPGGRGGEIGLALIYSEGGGGEGGSSGPLNRG